MATKFTDKLYGVIDVGSNSVRLLISNGKQSILKKVNITKLAEGLSGGSKLQLSAIERTARAVCMFADFAKDYGAGEILVFATAAVRQADNGADFVNRVKELCGLKVDVISGELEAEIGLLGALCGRDGGIVDIGGASTEISVLRGGKCVYSKSLPIGSVKITEAYGQDEEVVDLFVRSKVSDYGSVPEAKFYGIGGTATSIAAVILALDPYDPEKTNGFVLKKDQVLELKNRLFSMSVDARKKIKGLQPERAEVISGGVAILCAIMDRLAITEITVSENDNLEGYLMKYRRENE